MLRILTCLICLIAPVAQAEITVFAAASLRGVLQEVHETAPGDITVSYASSAALARQIAQGAPADVFLSANTDWVDWLAAQDVSKAFVEKDFLQNDLVLIGAPDHPVIDIQTLPDLLADDFLAMGHDRAVPAGIYAREALSSLELWDALQGRILQTENVSAALRLVALGEVPFGVTYATDALAEPRVKVLYRFDAKDHSPITYRLASLSQDPKVAAYLDHLDSPDARRVFHSHGFRDIVK